MNLKCCMLISKNINTLHLSYYTCVSRFVVLNKGESQWPVKDSYIFQSYVCFHVYNKFLLMSKMRISLWIPGKVFDQCDKSSFRKWRSWLLLSSQQKCLPLSRITWAVSRTASGPFIDNVNPNWTEHVVYQSTRAKRWMQSCLYLSNAVRRKLRTVVCVVR